MFNISDHTEISGYSGKRSTLQQALSDKNLHKDLHYDFFGARTQTGTVSVLIKGEWHSVRFSAGRGWFRRLEVQ